MQEPTNQLTADGEVPASDVVTVDGIVHQLLIEAEAGMRRARSDADHHKKGLDEASSYLVYWQGRADSLRLLLDRAAGPKTTPANAPTEPAAPALVAVASDEAVDAAVDDVIAEIRDFPLDDKPADRSERDSI